MAYWVLQNGGVGCSSVEDLKLEWWFRTAETFAGWERCYEDLAKPCFADVASGASLGVYFRGR